MAIEQPRIRQVWIRIRLSMKAKTADISVRAKQLDGILLERYCYTVGTVEPLAKHCHEEYQFGLSFNCAGQYHYRGAWHNIPLASLSIIHSGEVHAPSDRTELLEPATFWMMAIHPRCLETVNDDLDNASTILPFFSDIFLADRWLNQLFLTLCEVIDQPRSQLAQDVALWNFLSYLIVNYADNTTSIAPISSAHPNVKHACDYLHAYYASDVSLADLAAIAGLSRFHFSRVFRQHMGLSVSAYQTQLRVAHAKRLLTEGMAIATVASLTGFYDQSHFSQHFKRHVGATPGKYGEIAKIS